MFKQGDIRLRFYLVVVRSEVLYLQNILQTSFICIKIPFASNKLRQILTPFADKHILHVIHSTTTPGITNEIIREPTTSGS